MGRATRPFLATLRRRHRLANFWVWPRNSWDSLEGQPGRTGPRRISGPARQFLGPAQARPETPKIPKPACGRAQRFARFLGGPGPHAPAPCLDFRIRSPSCGRIGPSRERNQKFSRFPGGPAWRARKFSGAWLKLGSCAGHSPGPPASRFGISRDFRVGLPGRPWQSLRISVPVRQTLGRPRPASCWSRKFSGFRFGLAGPVGLSGFPSPRTYLRARPGRSLRICVSARQTFGAAPEILAVLGRARQAVPALLSGFPTLPAGDPEISKPVRQSWGPARGGPQHIRAIRESLGTDRSRPQNFPAPSAIPRGRLGLAPNISGPPANLWGRPGTQIGQISPPCLDIPDEGAIRASPASDFCSVVLQRQRRAGALRLVDQRKRGLGAEVG